MNDAISPSRPAIQWKAAILAGIVAGLVFLILEMMLVPMFLGGSPWGPPRMIGAMALGADVLPPPATFDIGVVLTAVVIHMVLSMLFAVVLAFVIRGWDISKAAVAGAIWGLVLYFLNFYVMTAIWPWFADARNWVSILSHLVFGLVAGISYVKMAHDHR